MIDEELVRGVIPVSQRDCETNCTAVFSFLLIKCPVIDKAALSIVVQSEATVERFPNAPIVEAILEIGVTLPADATGEKFLLFHDAIKSRFPQKQQRFQWTQQIKVPPVGGSLVVQSGNLTEAYGSVFLSSDGKKIVQISQTSFSFSQLKPYDRWDVFKTEAKTLWEQYREFLRPLSVNKLGLRYINRIVIPLPIAEYRDYCVLFPEFPPEMPQAIGNFFMRFDSWNQKIEAPGVVTLALEPITPAQSFVALIFDIDVGFLPSLLGAESNEIWAKYDLLREFKNRIFYSNLTEQAKNLFR